eukprot:5260829-Prymnesium_polylepis.2
MKKGKMGVEGVRMDGAGCKQGTLEAWQQARAPLPSSRRGERRSRAPRAAAPDTQNAWRTCQSNRAAPASSPAA